ncbi:MAG: hypothetical protein QW594_02640 [Candidatus Woesearchaeota archaeon]
MTHRKRVSSPRTWKILRRTTRFILSPTCSMSPDFGLPLGIILRDMLNLVSTIREAKYLLMNNSVLINGKRVRDVHAMVVFLDFISLGEQQYQLQFSSSGVFTLVPITKVISPLKPYRVEGFTLAPKGLLQVRLFSGKNLLFSKDNAATLKAHVKKGGSLLYDPNAPLLSYLPLAVGMHAIIYKGKKRGIQGTITALQEGLVSLRSADGITYQVPEPVVYVLSGKALPLSVLPYTSSRSSASSSLKTSPSLSTPKQT